MPAYENAVKPTAGEPAELSRVRSKNSNKAIGSAFTLKEIVIRICGILSLRETPNAGLLLAGFYEDHWDTQATPLNDYMPTSMATLAIKPDA